MSNDQPSTPLMQRLSGYWRELLGVEVVRPEDHFLEVGGNSLMATMLANRIEKDLDVQLSMVDLFNTLEHVAALCEEQLREQGRSMPAV
ncbi:phosphopantetheine-binding protein [Pyxidicoccus caerfyrddinensis]|uniref:phosphopantetheine-binding protein n=1 Tax=Pyxidicoccus caerfyrddinensis TaxID=2709663 RepID=UPI0013DCF616|nr:phosphopantetheine-binding protein [Pyxidicoccus caerfyrddinensis]